jgi:hypothetical protein
VTAPDAFAYLAEAVEACAVKLRGFDLLWIIRTDGVEVRVTQDDIMNSTTATWAELAQDIGVLPLKTGMCAAQVHTMREARDAGWRSPRPAP